MKPILRDITPKPDQSFVVRAFHLPYFNIPWHLHPQYELIYVQNSEGIRYVGSRIEPFKPGDLVLLGKNLPHCWLNAPIDECADKNFNTKYAVIQFHEHCFGNHFFHTPEIRTIGKMLQESSRGIHFTGNVVSKAGKIINQLMKFKDSKRLLLFLELLCILEACNSKRLLSSEGFNMDYPADEPDPIVKAKEYVLKNFKRKIVLDEVASYAGLNPTSLCRTFKKHQQKSLFDYIKNFRIGYATRLLRETNISVKEVCFESGYENLSNFYRQFKEITRYTPGEFRLS